MSDMDRAALVALVAQWRERPAPDKAVQLAYARCADALDAALAALPSGGAEGAPGSGQAPTRAQVEALQRYVLLNPDDSACLEAAVDGAWLRRDDVLALYDGSGQDGAP